ncbi:MAG: FKBP-type peptidyl-prolyl cis-trans isomerase [Paludibacter sp.]
MKRTALFSLFILLLTIILPACKEDVYMDWKIQNEKWLEIHKNDSGFQTTASGLSYKVIHQGYFLPKPTANSYVVTAYKGQLIDGSTFDSSTKYGNYVSRFVAGFQEGLKKMNVGGSYILYIPYKLGYDTISTNASIPPYSTLIFEVDLTNVYNQ